MEVVIDVLNAEMIRKQRKAESNRRYYEKKREALLAKRKEKYQSNQGGIKDYQKKYYQEHKDVQQRSYQRRKEFEKTAKELMAIAYE